MPVSRSDPSHRVVTKYTPSHSAVLASSIFMAESKLGRVYNWKADNPDHRDLLFSAELPPVTLPPSVDLRPLMPPVVDQGSIGSCTGNALSAALGFLEMKEFQVPGAQAQEFSENVYTPFSRLFIYFCERTIEGDPGIDAGACIRDGVQALSDLGACSEVTWPYDPSLTFQVPTDLAYQEAARHRIEKYMRLTSFPEIKACLAQGFPVVFGFSVYESFETPEVAQTGLMRMPDYSEGCLGGHAVIAVGYDDAKGHVIVRNSWGQGWGDQGYFYMPYAYISNRGLASDFWTLRLPESSSP